MSTHFAAVKDGIVIATRTSASRNPEATGKFGPYTHAVLRRERRVFLEQPDAPAETEDVISWHGGLRNAMAGLQAAKVGCSFNFHYDYRPRAEHFTLTYLHAELVDVIITPKKAKVGQRIS